MTTYTLVYTGQTTTLSLAQFESAMAAVALDTTEADTMGLTPPFSDTVTPFGAAHAQRTIVYKSSGAGVVPDPQVAQVLSNVYTAQLSRALSVPIDAAPVVVT
jgi:hypothetical protein